MSSHVDRIRAMLNSNGRTPEEAAAFRAKALELLAKYGLNEGDILRQAEKDEAERKARANASEAKPEGKGKAKKQPKDDGKLRRVEIKLNGRWAFYRIVSQPELRKFLKALREQGYTARSKVLKD